jgi:hypothetical protein
MMADRVEKILQQIDQLEQEVWQLHQLIRLMDTEPTLERYPYDESDEL